MGDAHKTGGARHSRTMIPKTRRACLHRFRGCSGAWPARALALWTLLYALTTLNVSRAGTSEESTLLVVNADSVVSMSVANAYLALRHVPAQHVLYLHGIPPRDTIPIEVFRQRILLPIEAYLEAQAWHEDISLVAYSAGFPYAIDFSADLKTHNLKCGRLCGKAGSITGLTFFTQEVLAGSLNYLSVSANPYFRRALTKSPPRWPTETERRAYVAAVEALTAKQYPAAIAALKKFTASYRWHPQAWIMLAKAHVEQDRPDAAIDALFRATEIGVVDLLLLTHDATFKPLRNHPKMPALKQRILSSVPGFAAPKFFTPRPQPSGNGRPQIGTPRPPYRLSVSLGYEGLRGNTVPEMRRYLRRAVASDGTHPKGTVYMMINHNKRSMVRQPFFQALAHAMTKRGRRTEILRQGQTGQDGIIPRGRDDAIGIVAGTRIFKWKKNDGELLPGAIAESFTSYGGHFLHASQTKLSEFLRRGAAGSSGAVREPYAYIEKFPVPQLHAYYADGFALAEAFYLSVASPYQLLIVGDPLARPFAKFADIDLLTPSRDSAWRGKVTLHARVKPAASTTIARLEAWLDGHKQANFSSQHRTTLDTTLFADGPHELTLVAVESGNVATRTSTTFAVTFANHGTKLTLETPTKPFVYGEQIALNGRCSHADRITLRQGSRVLSESKVHRGRYQLAVASSDLGLGHARVSVRAWQGAKLIAQSDGIDLEITAPPAARNAVSAPPTPGLKITVQRRGQAEKIVVVAGLTKQAMRKSVWHGGAIETLRVDGAFRVAEPGFYEVILTAAGEVFLTIDGDALHRAPIPKDMGAVRLARSLAAGWHTVHIELHKPVARMLQLLFYGPGPAFQLVGDRVRHQGSPAAPAR